MSKKKKPGSKQNATVQTAKFKKSDRGENTHVKTEADKKPVKAINRLLLQWLFFVLVITCICYLPILQNEFTNWDDKLYITNNPLLIGPDWPGIFTKNLVQNYHPLTIASYVLNYQVSGFEPWSYFLLNLLIHLANTGLVFYFAWLLSGNNKWVAMFTSLVFGIHPLHVESVAWISERKDVLYTLFFLLSLIHYWRYLQKDRKLNYWYSFIFFILSLLSKPAAIVLPLVLLLLDYWKGKPINLQLVKNKILFFVLSALFAVITLKAQDQAIAGIEMYPVWLRPFFACYTLMIYFFRFFIPYPLSAFHPYPSVKDPGFAILCSPLFIIALAIFLWIKRKDKLVIFGILFFIVNLLLVLQVVSIGQTIVSERYTYVPYIGIAFIVSMWLYKRSAENNVKWLAPAIVTLIFGFISFQRTKVWKNSNTLWTNAIKHFPNAAVPRKYRADYLAKTAAGMRDTTAAKTLFLQGLEDCNIALASKPYDAMAYEKREFINLNLNRNKEAIADANMLIQLHPESELGYYTRGMAYMRFNEPEKAFADFNRAVESKPDFHSALNNRGTLLLNYYKKYNEAITDFNKAISLNPAGNYYLNRSICYYKMGNMEKAKEDGLIAMQKGTVIPDVYKKILQIN